MGLEHLGVVVGDTFDASVFPANSRGLRNLRADPATQNGQGDGQGSVLAAHRRRAERSGQVADVNYEDLVVLAHYRHPVGREEPFLTETELFTRVLSLQRGEVVNSALDRREFLDRQGK